jgi:hypothetical protein
MFSHECKRTVKLLDLSKEGRSDLVMILRNEKTRASERCSQSGLLADISNDRLHLKVVEQLRKDNPELIINIVSGRLMKYEQAPTCQAVHR